MDPSFGTRLREQRERQHVTLTAIAAESRISIALLDGLERDDLSRWPGGLFRRAYIRAYAKAVGLDPEPMVREFLEHYPDPHEEGPDAQAVAHAASTRGGEMGPSTRIGILLSGLPLFRSQRHVSIRPTHGDGNGNGSNAVRATASITETAPPAPLEPSDLMAMARVCTALSCAYDESEVNRVLGDAAGVLNAHGMIVWAWDGLRAALCPIAAHGYSEALLQQLPTVSCDADNALAAAYVSREVRVVKGDRTATGALVTPLLTSDGCAGVLALEFGNGGEERESVRAFATMLSAQLSVLVRASLLPQAATG